MVDYLTRGDTLGTPFEAAKRDPERLMPIEAKDLGDPKVTSRRNFNLGNQIVSLEGPYSAFSKVDCQVITL